MYMNSFGHKTINACIITPSVHDICTLIFYYGECRDSPSVLLGNCEKFSFLKTALKIIHNMNNKL